MKRILRWQVTAWSVTALLGVTMTPTHAEQTPTHAEQQYSDAVRAMESFLTTWLADDDMALTNAMSHFSGSETATRLAPVYVVEYGQILAAQDLLPEGGNRADVAAWPGNLRRGELHPGIVAGYERLLSQVWPNPGWPDLSLSELIVVDETLRQVLNDLDVEYLRREPFVAYAVSNKMQIDAFDAGFSRGGFGELSSALSEFSIVVMVADFAYARSESFGPLIAFWGMDRDEHWRIQALGAFPPH